jgi:phosphate transport system substrate-binding protein
MKNKSNYISFIFLCLGSVILCSCNNNTAPTTPRDTTTSGSALIASDSLYKSMVDSEIQVFTSEYKDASIQVNYTNEAMAVKAFLTDSVKGIIIGRELKPSEIKIFKDKKKYEPRTVRLATDAVAVIVHPDNPVDEITVDQLNNIINGTTTDWGNGTKISVIIDNEGSGMISFLQDSVLKGGNFGKTVFALPAGQSMLDYISSHKNAVGFIGVNQITSYDKDSNQLFPKEIKPLGISKLSGRKFYKPYQAYVASRNYPLLRFTNFIFNETHKGITSGFASFIGSDKGQRIILKDGLVPSNSPIRLIQINN